MTRHLTAAMLLVGIGALLLLDRGMSAPLNPYLAPPLLALGSGEAPSGAHCAAPPPG